MKKNKLHPAVRIVGVALVVSVAGVLLWNQLDLGTKWRISSSVDDLANGVAIETSRKELRETPRGPTIEALKNVLASDDGTPWGKVQVLGLLAQFKESRAVMRAIDSDQLTTQRAAAYLRQTDTQSAEKVATIAMAWFKDSGSVDRRLAVLILQTIKYRDALPELIRVLDTEGDKRESAATIVNVLNALGQFKPEGIAPQILKLAADASLEPAVRSAALKTLTFLDDTPREELLKILLSIAQDGGANTNLRTSAVSLLSRPQNAGPEAWEILRTIILDPDNSQLAQQVLQRTALRALVASYPIDKIGELLLDRRIYTHPYFGIRTDVASGIGNLRLRSRLALQILTELLAEKDRSDFMTNVSRQAWISFWMLTGIHSGSSRPELFRNAPKQMKDESVLRRHVFSIAWITPGIDRQMIEALDPFTLSRADNKLRQSDRDAYDRLDAEKFEKRKAISQILRDQIDNVVQEWEEKD